jgi:hypothetical protein
MKRIYRIAPESERSAQTAFLFSVFSQQDKQFGRSGTLIFQGAIRKVRFIWSIRKRAAGVV